MELVATILAKLKKFHYLFQFLFIVLREIISLRVFFFLIIILSQSINDYL